VRLSRVTALALSLAGLATLGPVGGAAAAPGWQPPVSLSAPGQNADQPRLAFDPQGDALVVWRRFGPGHGVQAASRPAGGAFGPPESISLSGGAPQVGFDAGGEAIAVWHRRSQGIGGCSLCVEAAFRSPGGTFGPPQRVPVAGEKPRLAVDRAGNAIVLARHPGGTAKPIHSAVRPAGGPFRSGQKVAGGQTGLPQVAFDARGRATAIWSRGVHVEAAFAGRRGTFGKPRFVGPGDIPELALDRRGDALVVWRRGVFPDARVRARYRRAGRRFGRIQTLSGPDAGDETDAALDRRGNGLAIWWRRGPRGGNFRLQTAYRPAGRRFRRARTIAGKAKRIGEPQVAFDSRGNALAVWWRDLGGNRGTLVQASYRPAGRRFRKPRTIARATEGVGSLQLAVGPRGDALAVWEDLEYGQGLTPTGSRIRAAAFAPGRSG
jgi:hypothetical protein